MWDFSLYLPYINHGLPHGFKEQQNFNTLGSSGKEGDVAARWNVKLQLAQSAKWLHYRTRYSRAEFRIYTASQTGCEIQSAPYSLGHVALSTEESDHGVKLSAHLYPIPRLRRRVTTLPIPHWPERQGARLSTVSTLSFTHRRQEACISFLRSTSKHVSYVKSKPVLSLSVQPRSFHRPQIYSDLLNRFHST